MHIIDRCGAVNSDTADYYRSLGGETGFLNMTCDALEAETISDGGGPLVAKGKIQKVDILPIVFVSVLFQ